MTTKDHFIIHDPEDYKLHYHMSPEGIFGWILKIISFL